VQVNVTFSAVALYQLSFVETGLPNGTVWFVAISNGSTGAEWNGSANSSVDFLVPNGTYDFYVGNASSGDCWSNGTTYVPSPQFGNVTVNGSSVTEAIAFAPLAFYNLTFVASGLPNGTNWSVSIYNDSTGWEWNGSANLSVTFLVPNGTYNFSVENVTNGSALYVPAPMSGTVVVDGAAAVVDVAFSAVALYNVSFVESGLPNGTFWFVELTGGAAGWAANGSCNTTVSFLVPNGTYGFTIGGSFPDGFWNLSGLYTPSPAAGNLTVAGANVSVDVSFTAEALYSVTFSEIGLPNGTFWSVLIGAFPWTGSGNGSPAAVIGPACFQFWNGSNNSSISFALPNGTHPFFIGPVFEGSPCNVSAAFVAEPNNGTVTVNGTAVTVDVTFVPAPVPAPAPLASGGSPPGALAAHHPSPSASFPALAGLPLVGALGALAATLGALLLYLRRPLA